MACITPAWSSGKLGLNTYANVILERSLRANECHIGVNENILTMKQI